MADKGITGLLLAVTIGAVFFVPVVDAIDSSTGEVQIENETVTNDVNYTETYELSNDDVLADSETLEYDDAGTWTTLTAGTDYTIDDANGTVQFESGGVLTEGDSVRASYTYQATEGTVTTVAGLLPLFLALLLLVPMANEVQRRV
ncbi:MAG: hypothetical protein HQRvContig02_17 [Haloquadratum phage sp.]|nr:MAG: hypothetical protein HQRvContig02_17 [Haloquadratum phage sp.]